MVLCANVIGVCVAPGPAMAVDVACDDADERAAVLGGQQLHLVAFDRLVARRGELVLARQVHPQLDAVEHAAALDQFGRRGLDVQDARARGHPLRGAVGDQAAAAVAESWWAKRPSIM